MDALNYSANNHGSIVEINGQCYVFYHRQTNRHQFSRQACAEPIVVEKDGSIKQVEITSCGLNNGPLIGTEEYHPYFTQDGEDREDNPNQHIANMNEGSVAGFKYFIFDKVEEISVKVRGNGNGVFLVSTEIGDKPVAEVPVKAQDEWNVFSAPMRIEEGVKPLYFTYEGEGYVDFMSFTIK